MLRISSASIISEYPAVLRVELLGGRYPFADEFGQQVQLFHRRGDRIVGGDPVFDPGHLLQLLLGLARIVPEVRRMGQRLLLVEFEPPVVDMQVGMERRLPLLERFDLFGGNHLSCRLWLFGSSGQFVRFCSSGSVCSSGQFVRPFVRFVVSFFISRSRRALHLSPPLLFPAPPVAGRGMCRPAVSVLTLPRGPVCRVPVPPAGGPLGRRSFDLPPPVLSRGPSGLFGGPAGVRRAVPLRCPVTLPDSVCCRVSRDGPSLPKPNRECPVPRPAPRSSSALRSRNLVQSVRRGLAVDRVNHHAARGDFLDQ